MATRYTRKVRPINFDLGDLVLRRADVGKKNTREGKQASNSNARNGMQTNSNAIIAEHQ